MELAGKTAIVTGAAWGIGRATTLALVAAGARIVATDLDEEREGLDEVVSLGDGAVTPCLADVASEDDWRRVVETAGEVDVLVNNAGGVMAPYYPEASSQRWRSVLDVNLYGVMLGIQAVLESMRRGGGAIVNVASVAGLMRGFHRAPEYAAAKAGVIALTTALGEPLWEGDRISITCICPDWVLTEAVQRAIDLMSEEELAEVRGVVPVEEIAGLIVRLATDESLAGRVLVRWADEDGERLLPLGRET